MKLYYNICFFILLTFSLIACDDTSTISGSSNGKQLIGYEMIKLSRQGGKCLGEPEVTEENESCARIEIRYPSITDTPDEGMKAQLNDSIRKKILSSYTNEEDSSDASPVTPESVEQLARSFIEEHKKEMKDSRVNWNLDKFVDVSLNTPEIISFQIQDSGYTGGAHGYNSLTFMNVELDIMQEIKLSDLLLPGYEAELNITGEKIFRQVHELPIDVVLDAAGFWFDNNDFTLNDNFAIREKGLLFYFNAYDVAPYAFGATEVLIPYSDIQNLIDPNGTLAVFLKNRRKK